MATMDQVRTATRDQHEEMRRRLQEPYVPRRVALPAATGNLVRAVLGPRRAGKSLFAMHLLEREGAGIYLNFDDERLTGIDDYDALLSVAQQEYGPAQAILLDEVQNLPQWELFVNRLQRQGWRIIVTGSNAHLLSSELSTHLTGRHLPVVLMPFSLREFADALKVPASQPGLLARYARQGGLPEPLLQNMNAEAYTSALVDSVVLRDVIQRFHLRALQGLGQLTRYMLSNIGSEYAHAALTRVVGCRSDKTVERYLHYLRQAFLLLSVPRFSWSVRQQAATNKKAYAVDSGFAAARGFAVSTGIGRLAENAVASALYRRQLQGELEFFFWKSQQNHEVDFVVKEGTAVTALVQVCWDASEPDVRQREERALLRAGNELKCSSLLVLTQDEQRDDVVAWFGLKAAVRYIPLWQWLLSQDEGLQTY